VLTFKKEGGTSMVFKRFKASESLTFVIGKEETEVRFRKGKTILETALENEIPLDHSCTAGTCGSCRIIVLEAPIPLEERGDVESDTAQERGFGEDERLACLNEACAGLKVRIPQRT
jgi:ferredoxin, 2Fe-2S